MPVTITSTTDTPEDVAEAMKAELEGDEGEGEQSKTDDSTDKTKTENTNDKEVKDDEATSEEDGQKDGKEKVTKGKVKLETDDEKEGDEDDDEKDGDGDEEDSTAQPKPKKVTGYKKRAMRLEEENRLLLDLLKKQNNPDTDDRQDDSDDKGKGDDKSDKSPKTYSGIAEPTLADFKDDADPYAAFTVAYAKWAKSEAVAELRAEQRANDSKVQQTAEQKSFTSRLTEVRKDGGIYSDYDSVLESIADEDLPITPLMNKLIMTAKAKDGTPISVDVMHYLASNPDTVREIAALPPEEQAAEMGVVRQAAWAETQKRLAAVGKSKGKTKSETKEGKSDAGSTTDTGTSTSAQTQSSTKPKPKTPPPPITPVGKRQAPASGDLATVAESGDFRAYEQRRSAQGFKYR